MIQFRKKLGRISRIEFLLYSLILAILWIANYHLLKIDALRYLVYYFLIIYFLVLSKTRINDYNNPLFQGWYWWIVPFYNIYVLFEMYLRKGDPETNHYGIPSNFILTKRKNKKLSLTDNEKTEIVEDVRITTRLIERKLENAVVFHFSASEYTSRKRWMVNEGDFIVKGQVIIVVESNYKFFSGEFEHEIISPMEGYIHILIKESLNNQNVSNKDIFAIYMDDLQRQKENYNVNHRIINDKFSQSESIVWDNININSDFRFHVENTEGKDFICFEFNSHSYRFSSGDKILVLLSNNEVIDFPLIHGSYKISNNVKGYKVSIYDTDIDKLCEHFIEGIRLSFEMENFKKDIFGETFYNISKKDLQFVIRLAFQNFKDVVSKQINHQSLTRGEEELIETNEKCFVYLMIDRKNNYYKIGISNKPEYREKTLQSEKPTIELICHKHFPSRKMAESIEKAFHNMYKENRIRGEWFNLTPDEVKEIVSTLS